MEVADLEYLAASADAQSFSRAAAVLGINASTVSRRIGRLEDELGLALFERSQRGIRPTSGGKAVLLHVRRALAEIDGIRLSGRQNGSAETGLIRLGVRMPPIGEPLADRKSVV